MGALPFGEHPGPAFLRVLKEMLLSICLSCSAVFSSPTATDQLLDQCTLLLHVQVLCIRCCNSPSNKHHCPRIVAIDPKPAVAAHGCLKRQTLLAKRRQHSNARFLGRRHKQPTSHQQADGEHHAAHKRAQPVRLARIGVDTLQLGIEVLGGQRDARIDERSRVEVGTVLARGAGKREDGEDGTEGRSVVGCKGDNGIVGGRVQDLADNEVASCGVVLHC